jgi:hypothetical protein
MAGARLPEQVEMISRFEDDDPARLAPPARELIERNVGVVVAVSTVVANVVRTCATNLRTTRSPQAGDAGNPSGARRRSDQWSRPAFVSTRRATLLMLLRR